MKCLNHMRIVLSVLAFGLLASFAVHAQSVNALFHNGLDPVAGNPKGKITVVEFFDYDCGHCISMAPVMDSILKTNSNVRIIFKDLPIRGPMSEFAARAAVAAQLQHKYYVFNHALLVARRPLSPQSVMQIAEQVGLNTEQLKRDMNSKAVRTQINSNLALANQLGVNGTPAFFIGKTNASDSEQVKMILGEMSKGELQDAIKQAAG